LPSINIDREHVLSLVASSDDATVVFLHGIMGNKKNLQTFISRFVDEMAHDVIAFDLRNHGESSKHWAPFTVEAAGRDIVSACTALSIKPTALVGHSFGGKVALMAASLIKSVEQVWLLDCSPGMSKPAEIPTQKVLTTLQVIDVLAGLNWPLPSRKVLVEQLQERGVSKSIALWMTTNVIANDDGVRLVFALSEVKAILLDFVRLDGWPLVKSLSLSTDIHLVAALRGGRVSGEDQKALLHFASHRGYFHELDAGHFVHADNPADLLTIMRPYFRR
jgi:pimeloyl-ACP methyl ester carboxylesterase